MKLSIIDGVLYALMVGCSEMYFLADVVRLGASTLEKALVITLPLFIGAAGPLLCIGAMGRRVRRKRIVVTAVSLQALALAILATAELTGAISVHLLMAVACGYQVCGQAAGTAWSSWYGDLVPARVRGRYFARRNRGAHIGTCVAVIGAGLVLQRLEPAAPGLVSTGAGGHGYALIYTAAALFRTVSAVLLALSPEPDYAGVADRRTALSTLTASGSVAVRRAVIMGFAMQLMVYVGSPYFAPFMLEELGLSYIEYTVATLSVVLLKVASLSAWGKAIDRYGPRAVYALAAVMVGLIPLPWLGADGLAWVIAAQMLSGFSWAGYEVSHFSLILESSESRTRPHVLAVQFLLTGTAQLAGSLLGGLLLASSGRGYLTVFAATMLGRLGVAVFVPYLLAQSAEAPRVRRRAVLLRIVGFRPSGGVGYRPAIIDTTDPE